MKVTRKLMRALLVDTGVAVKAIEDMIFVVVQYSRECVAGLRKKAVDEPKTMTLQEVLWCKFDYLYSIYSIN